MDPDEALRKLREYEFAVRELQQTDEWDEWAECFRALDQWLSNGGFPPKDWQH